MKVIKMYKFPIIRQVGTRDVMYNVTNRYNTTMPYMKAVKIANPQNSHHKENYFSFFLYKMLNVH